MTERTSVAAGLLHLVRRFVGSLSRREPSSADTEAVARILSPAELRLWSSMRVEDRRHSIEVLRRFDDGAPEADAASRAAALLHDVGKLDSALGTLGRVVATAVGPRWPRMRAYHEHEAIGARMLESVGSDPVTVATVLGVGPWSEALRRADDGVMVRSPCRRQAAQHDLGEPR